MAQPDAASVASNISQELFSMLEREEQQLDSFTRKRIERDINKVTDIAKRLFLSGLLSVVYNEIEKGIDACEQAIRLAPHDLVMWENYTTMIWRIKGTLASYRVRLRSLDYINQPSFLLSTLLIQQQLNDFKAALETVDLLEKILGTESAKKLFNELGDLTVDEMIELNKKPQAETAKDVTKLMFSLAEEEHNFKVKTTFRELETDSDTFCIEMFLPNIKLEELKSINRQLLAKRRELGLATSEVVGLFREYLSADESQILEA
ncbi:hypothetical protein CBP31_08165 [Oceanisphaera profunda]|uniref:Uncharacterized protein n=1 Tax=Oceanisphaera profunda TaxID=1416627 RepID=A0A1Y0D5Z5_9GAMM|nr:hypothetical protein [Oceanisphaera profunda]ART82596.1 hypothetical protein CBP31_08165 [Oceanisphaera profunda]